MVTITFDDILTAIQTAKEQNLEPKALKVCPSAFDRLRESVGLFVLDPALRERPLRITEIMGMKIIVDPAVPPDEFWLVAERRYPRVPELIELLGEVSHTAETVLMRRVEPETNFLGPDDPEGREAVAESKKTRAEIEKLFRGK